MIQLNTPTKLSPKVIWYRSISLIVVVAILYVIFRFVASLGTMNATVNGNPTTLNVGFMGPLVTPGAILLLCLIILYNILYYKTYSFILEADKISITSGVIFPSTQTTNFKTIQNVSTLRGPVLKIFGLEIVQGFTSSPGQLIITSGRNGTSTTYRPDILIPLLPDEAEQLRSQIAQSSEVDKVKIVQ